MPRRARQTSDTGIYHVMMRGINPQSPLPKGAPPHPVVPHPQGRDKLKIAGTDDLQSFGIARKACALKGERCLLECPQTCRHLPHSRWLWWGYG